MSKKKAEPRNLRRINLYLPTAAMKTEWKLAAEESKCTLSEYIVRSVRRASIDNQQIKADTWRLQDEVRVQKEEIKRLSEDNRRLNSLVRHMDQEMRKYRTQT